MKNFREWLPRKYGTEQFNFTLYRKKVLQTCHRTRLRAKKYFRKCGSGFSQKKIRNVIDLKIQMGLIVLEKEERKKEKA